MTAMALLFILAAAGFGLAKWLRLPVIPVLLLIGIGLALTGLKPPEELTRNALELGLTFLVFAAGIELNPKRFSGQLRAVLSVGIIQFTLAGLAGFMAARTLGYDKTTALYLAFALSASSTLVVVRHLRQRQRMFQPYARLVTGVLLVQDLAMILLIVVLARYPEGPAGVAVAVGGTAVLAGLAVVCRRWLMPYLLIRLKLGEEILLLLILASLFAFVGLSSLLKIPPITGAFFAGFSLSSFPVSGVVRGLLNSLSDFFVAIFFTALGAIVVLPAGPVVVKALLLAALVVVLTPPLVTVIAEWTGLSSRHAIESGLLLAQTSEFSLILGLTGLFLGHITQEVFSVIVIAAVVTMTLTPFLATSEVARRLLRFHPLRRVSVERSSVRDHIVVIGFGQEGMWVVKPLMEEGHRVVVVDDDPAVIEQLQMTGIPCLRGDGSDEKILERVGARRAKLIIVSMRRTHDAARVLQRVGGMPVLVRVFEDEDAEQIHRLGGTPVLNSQAAARTFMEWFEKTEHAGPTLQERVKARAD